MDTESEQPTEAADTRRRTIVKSEAGEVAEEVAVAHEDEAQEERESERLQMPVGFRATITSQAESEGQPETEAEEEGEGTEARIQEEGKAARKARLKKNRNIRFTLGESEYAPVEIVETTESVKADEEQTEINEDNIQIDPTESMVDRFTKIDSLDGTMRSLIADEIEVDSLFTDDDDDDEEEDFEVREPPKGDTIVAKSNFLNDFEMPSLSDISEEHSIEEVVFGKSLMTAASSYSVMTDTGKFVDPLTGEVLESSSTQSTTSSAKSEEAEEAEDDSDDLLDFSDTDLLDFRAPVKLIEDDDMDAFVQFQASFIQRSTTGVDLELLESMRLKREVQQIAYDFLYELFANVVNEAENVDEDALRQNKLDRSKLQERLSELRDLFLYEKDVSMYLNSKMCEYYKRMKNFRVLSRLPQEVTEKERTRYLEALSQLDHVKKVAAETKKKNAILMSSVLMDLSYVQNIVMNTEEHLEEIILRTLTTNKSDFLKRVVERELRLMNQKRCEISDERLFLITRKHTLGRITDKITKLEQINEDLCMDDFISIQNQVVALDKKIEERNNELKKLRYSYHTELHLTQHNREKALALCSKLRGTRRTLQKLQDEQHSLRERLYKAKLERSNIRKQHSDLSFQGGLLAMPALMHDFDETVERVSAKQANVKELKETFKRVTQRISELETRCA